MILNTYIMFRGAGFILSSNTTIVLSTGWLVLWGRRLTTQKNASHSFIFFLSVMKAANPSAAILNFMRAKGGHSPIKALSGYPWARHRTPKCSHGFPAMWRLIQGCLLPSPICSWLQPPPHEPGRDKVVKKQKIWQNFAILKGKIAFGKSPLKKNQTKCNLVLFKSFLYLGFTHLSLMEVPNIHNGIIYLCSEVRGRIRLWGVEHFLRTLLAF